MEVKCNQCNKPAIGTYGDKPLCVDCFHKIAQANFMEQQINHNQLSWSASHLNFTEQALHARTLIPLKMIQVPPPPVASLYNTYNNFQISQSAIGVINPGTLFAIDTNINVMNDLGESELATAIKELTEKVINSTDLVSDVKNEISELLKFLSSEALANRSARNKSVIKQVLDRLSTLIPATAAVWEIWDRIQPILRSIGA